MFLSGCNFNHISTFIHIFFIHTMSHLFSIKFLGEGLCGMGAKERERERESEKETEDIKQTEVGIRRGKRKE